MRMSELWYERKNIMDAEGHMMPVALEEAVTLRDQFAMAALTGMLMRSVGYEETAEKAYKFADAMLKSRAALKEKE